MPWILLLVDLPLEVDDLIIVDNLPAHHGEAETALNEFFDDM